MGFLKFLRREKKRDEFEDLDLPPAPPSLEGFEENIPELPEMPELPDMGKEDISGEELPKFDFPEEEKMPDFGNDIESDLTFPEPEKELLTPIPLVSATSTPPIPEPAPTPQVAEEPKQEEVMEEEEPSFAPSLHLKTGRRLFSHERIARERPAARIIYVKVDDFKLMLGTINAARSDLRKSEESLNKLENIKASKDKSFDKIRASLDDLQKKLIFVDKTLFKGD